MYQLKWGENFLYSLVFNDKQEVEDEADVDHFISVGHPTVDTRSAVPLQLCWPAHTWLLYTTTHRPGSGTGRPVVLSSRASRIPNWKLWGFLPAGIYRVSRPTFTCSHPSLRYPQMMVRKFEKQKRRGICFIIFRGKIIENCFTFRSTVLDSVGQLGFPQQGLLGTTISPRDTNPKSEEPSLWSKSSTIYPYTTWGIKAFER